LNKPRCFTAVNNSIRPPPDSICCWLAHAGAVYI
jgi:hypothetical protein